MCALYVTGQSLVEAHEIWRKRAVPKINCDVSFHMAVTWFGEQVPHALFTVAVDMSQITRICVCMCVSVCVFFPILFRFFLNAAMDVRSHSAFIIIKK